VTLVAGAAAGAAGALLSAPADAVVTELASGRSATPRDAVAAVASGKTPPFAGAAERMVLFAVVITVQLVLFDACRATLDVAPENLSLSLDVFADRLSFYDVPGAAG